jgi:uncharacterized phiE125 gp8 family phage protein
MGLKVIVPVSSEPVSLAEVKAWVRKLPADEDTLIAGCARAAREAAEGITGRAIGRQRLRLTLDAFEDAIELRRPPFVSMVSLKYLDLDGVEQTFNPASIYVDDGAEGWTWLVPAYGIEWPDTQEVISAVRVEYEAGYDSTTIPESLRRWICAFAADLFDNRSGINVGNIVTPMSFMPGLIGPHIIHSVG